MRIHETLRKEIATTDWIGGWIHQDKQILAILVQTQFHLMKFTEFNIQYLGWPSFPPLSLTRLYISSIMDLPFLAPLFHTSSFTCLSLQYYLFPYFTTILQPGLHLVPYLSFNKSFLYYYIFYGKKEDSIKNIPKRTVISLKPTIAKIQYCKLQL